MCFERRRHLTHSSAKSRRNSGSADRTDNFFDTKIGTHLLSFRSLGSFYGCQIVKCLALFWWGHLVFLLFSQKVLSCQCYCIANRTGKGVVTIFAKSRNSGHVRNSSDIAVCEKRFKIEKCCLPGILIKTSQKRVREILHNSINSICEFTHCLSCSQIICCSSRT